MNKALKIIVSFMLLMIIVLSVGCVGNKEGVKTTVTPALSKSPEPSGSSAPVTTSETPMPTEPVYKEVKLTREELLDKIDGGWIGQMAGVVWAAPTEFCWAGQLIPTSNVPKWDSSKINDGFGQDDLYVEIPFLEAMRLHGVDCDPSYLADSFKKSQFALWHANYMGRENLKNGIAFPDSGSYLYNYHADDIDWQIECDFLGMLYPGKVSLAAERAFELGHIMNYGDGVYGGVFITAMHSAAFTAGSIEEICRAGIEVIPEGTLFRSLVDDVWNCYKEGKTFEQNWKMLQDKWAGTDLCPELPGDSNIDAKLNSGYVLLGLLYGNGDVDETIKLSMRCGQDSDCNPSSAASILGNYYGASKLPEKYTEKLDRTKTKFSYTTYTFDKAVNMNLELMEKNLEILKDTKDENGVWTIKVDEVSVPVKYEQWPDGVFVYVNTSLSQNMLKFNEITPYSKNEEVVGYTIDFGDGKSIDDVTPARYVYAQAGEYTLTVTVKGSKGSVYKYEKTLKVGSTTHPVEDILYICTVTKPSGGGNKDITIINDGKIPTKNGTDSEQYDTYILGDPHGNPGKTVYIGYVYSQEKSVSVVKFTEGNHFGNGGWFKDGDLRIEIYDGEKWTQVKTAVSPAYPKGNSRGTFGDAFETYTFTFDKSYNCYGVRLIGTAGGSSTFISVAELDVK